ncbi:hypothetical protein, partial [Nocardia gipuzkoensis]
TRRPLGREPGRERRMLGLASLETWSFGERGTWGACVFTNGSLGRFRALFAALPAGPLLSAAPLITRSA